MVGRLLTVYVSRVRLFSRNARLFLLGDACIGVGMTFWMLLFNLYLKELGASWEMSPAETGLFIGRTTAVAQIAAAAFALPAGYFAVRLRHRTLLIGAQALSSFAYMAAIMAGTPGSLNAWLFTAAGFAVFMFVVSGPFTMANTTPKERTYVFSLVFTLRLVGGVLGNAAAGRLKDGAAGWGLPELEAYRWVILAGVAFSLIGILPFLALEETGGDGAARRPFTLAELKAMNWGLFSKALFPTFLLAIGAGLIVQFLNLYLKDTFPGLSDSGIGLCMSLQFATMVFGLMAAPAAAERYGKVNTICATQLASIPFMLLLAFTADLRIAVAALVIRAALMNMSWPVWNTLIMELCTKREQGILSALFTMSWNLSWAVSAVIFGRMAGDYRTMFLVAVGLYLIATALYFVFFKGLDAPPETGPAEPLDEAAPRPVAT